MVTLAFVQGLGVLSLHAHDAGTPGHSHAFVTHGDDHMGHADDVVEVDRGHAAPTDGSAPTARHLVAPPLLVAVMALTVLTGLGLAVSTRTAWPPPPAPPPRLRLAQLALLRV